MPARKIFWSVFASHNNFPEPFLDDTHVPLTAVAIL